METIRQTTVANVDLIQVIVMVTVIGWMKNVWKVSSNEFYTFFHKIFFLWVILRFKVPASSSSYSTVPNNRTYLNSRTYLNFFLKTITIPTQITVPTRKPYIYNSIRGEIIIRTSEYFLDFSNKHYNRNILHLRFIVFIRLFVNKRSSLLLKAIKRATL